MDEFKYTVTLENINKITSKTRLKKLLKKYMAIASPNYKLIWLDTYDDSYDIKYLTSCLYAQKLAKAITARYIDIGGSKLDLPQYAFSIDFDVNVTMSLEQAVKWIKHQQGE